LLVIKKEHNREPVIYLPLDADLFLYFIDLRVDLRGIILCFVVINESMLCLSQCWRLTFAMILVERNNFVHCRFGSISTPLRFFDLLRIAALVDDEIEDVEHDGNIMLATVAEVYVGR
jgi:hypothetical protein